MSYSNKDVTKDEINLWKKNKLINPRTNRKIKLDSKIYKYLQEMEKSLSKQKKNKIKKTKNNSDQKLEESITQTELTSVLQEESITQTETVSKSDAFIQTDSSNNEIDNLKSRITEIEGINDTNDSLINEKESQINKLNEKLKIKENESIELKKSINNLDNSNNNLRNELDEKNKLLEENNKKIEELKNQIKKDKSNKINYETNKPSSNNLILVVPIAILCIGWVIKKSFFGF